MIHFPNPGQGVLASLEMVDGVVEAGMPPAHVGLHAGPVIFQEGDYYGQTVNVAARIAAHAQAGRCSSAGRSSMPRAAPGSPSGRSARWSSRACPER